MKKSATASGKIPLLGHPEKDTGGKAGSDYEFALLKSTVERLERRVEEYEKEDLKRKSLIEEAARKISMTLAKAENIERLYKDLDSRAKPLKDVKLEMDDAKASVCKYLGELEPIVRCLIDKITTLTEVEFVMRHSRQYDETTVNRVRTALVYAFDLDADWWASKDHFEIRQWIKFASTELYMAAKQHDAFVESLVSSEPLNVRIDRKKATDYR